MLFQVLQHLDPQNRKNRKTTVIEHKRAIVQCKQSHFTYQVDMQATSTGSVC